MKKQTNTAQEKLLKEAAGSNLTVIVSIVATAVIALLFCVLASRIDTGIRQDVLTQQALEIRFVGRS